MKKADPETDKMENAESAEPLAPNEPAPITPEKLEALQADAAKAAEHWERLVRVTADFDNFKKRAARDKQEAIRFANEGLIEKLVPVLDNFDMALAATQNAGDSAKSLTEGVAMIYQQFKGVLVDAGLEEINATGQPFDPNWHEAVSQQETTEAAEGTVVQQLRKGYKLRERLMRPATVVVAKQPSA